MSLTPLNQEQVQQTSQILLAFLSDQSVSVPGNLLEGVVSGKSLLRGIVSGQLVLCQNQAGAPGGDPKDKDVKKDGAKKTATKKAVIKKAA